MTRFIVLDIETVSHPDAGQWLGPVKADSRLKDPVKIAESISEKTARRDDELALDWDCCKVAAVGFVVVGSNEPWCEVCTNDTEETNAIHYLWKTYRTHPDTRFVTFNGHRFDLPVLLTRSIDLGVKHPPLNLNRFKSQHLDVWQYLTRDGARQYPHGLGFYAKKYGFTTLDKVEGKDVATLMAAENFEAVRGHCLSDVGLTHALAAKLGLLEAA